MYVEESKAIGKIVKKLADHIAGRKHTVDRGDPRNFDFPSFQLMMTSYEESKQSAPLADYLQSAIAKKLPARLLVAEGDSGIHRFV